MTTERRSPGRPRKLGKNEDQTHDRILHVSSEMFMQFGYEHVSLMHIAKQCDVTKATLYYYYSNKANLFTKAFCFILGMVKSVTSQLLQQEKPMKERLIDLAIGHFANARADFGTVMNNAKPFLSEEQISQIHKAENEVHLVISNFFEEAMKSGKLTERDPYFMAQIFMSMLMAGHHAPVKQRFENHREMARALVDLFWNGARK